ncbi:DUF6193 family natural product biosynthesis protein [Streptomyces sp. NPDC048196]|uniref:DUF6193 family natural product biosynthesis protein n=1 Tax=Streptomyces sp. NPDC048196 TaxID=3154712 RepID=UPI0033D62C68
MTDLVAAAWHKHLTTAGEPARPRATTLQEAFIALVRAAHAEPQLRQLYPWMGMWELHFSRCTEGRPTWDIPYAGTAGDDRYYIEGPSPSSPRIAGTESPWEAVAMVIERLPEGCGPAFVGSAEDLVAYARAHGLKEERARPRHERAQRIKP